MRTAIFVSPEGVVQKVLDRTSLDYKFISLSEYKKCETYDCLNIQEILHAEGSRPLDIGSGNVIRLSVIQAASNKYYVLVALHHAAGDGASVSLMMDEAWKFYFGYSEDQLPSLSIQ